MRTVVAIAIAAALAGSAPAHADPPVSVKCPPGQLACGVPCNAAEICIDMPWVCVFSSCVQVPIDWCAWIDGYQPDLACVPMGDEVPPPDLGPLPIDLEEDGTALHQ